MSRRRARNERIVSNRATRRASSNNSGCALFVVAFPALSVVGAVLGWWVS